MAEDDDLVMPEVPANEAVMDPVVALEEEPRDSGVDPESSPSMISLPFLPFCFSLLPLADTFFLVSLPADLPQDSDDFDPSMTQLLTMLQMSSWRQKAFRRSKKVLCSDNLDFFYF